MSATLSKLDQRLASLQRANESLRAQLAAQGQPRPIIDTTSGRPLVEKAEVQAPGPEPEAALAQADPVAAFDALEEGRTLLDRAVARGRWSNDDRANLHRLLARTDSDGTSELLTALATAINSDKLLPVL